MNIPDTETTSATPHPGTANEQDAYSRVRVFNLTADRLRNFSESHGISCDEAIVCLIEAHERYTKYRYSAESGHLIAAMRVLDADVVHLANINTQLIELFCRLKATDYLALASQIEQTAKRI